MAEANCVSPWLLSIEGAGKCVCRNSMSMNTQAVGSKACNRSNGGASTETEIQKDLVLCGLKCW